MSNAKIIMFEKFKELQDAKKKELEYRQIIPKLDKFQLLEEMLRFQDERQEAGTLTIQLILKGRILFEALESVAETDELKLLTGSYKKHLEYELEEYLKNKKIS